MARVMESAVLPSPVEGGMMASGVMVGSAKLFHPFDGADDVG